MLPPSHQCLHSAAAKLHILFASLPGYCVDNTIQSISTPLYLSCVLREEQPYVLFKKNMPQAEPTEIYSLFTGEPFIITIWLTLLTRPLPSNPHGFGCVYHPSDFCCVHWTQDGWGHNKQHWRCGSGPPGQHGERRYEQLCKGRWTDERREHPSCLPA